MIEYREDTDFEELLRGNRAVVLQYGSETCAPCHALKLKIDSWQQEHPEVLALYISIDGHARLAAQNGVLSVPSVVVYVDGHEMIKESGYFSLDHILDRTERYLSMLQE